MRGGDAALPPLVGAAFVFSGKSTADEVVVLAHRGRARCEPRAIPDPGGRLRQIRAERARPLLALVLWRAETANDPSLLAIAYAIAVAFLGRSE